MLSFNKFTNTYAKSLLSCFSYRNERTLFKSIRQFHSNKLLNDNIALVINIAEEHLYKINDNYYPIVSERSFLSVKVLNTIFKNSNLFSEKNITILFGNENLELLVKMYQPDFLIKGVPSLKKIEETLDEFSNKLDTTDRVWIFIYGHSDKAKGFGVFGHDYISPEFLQKKLEKLKCSKITLIVNSCYSGIYNQLTSSKIAVLTSSDSTHVDLSRIGGDYLISIAYLAFQNQSVLFDSHLIASHYTYNSWPLAYNLYSFDSLQYLIQTTLKKKLNKEFKESNSLVFSEKFKRVSVPSFLSNSIQDIIKQNPIYIYYITQADRWLIRELNKLVQTHPSTCTLKQMSLEDQTKIMNYIEKLKERSPEQLAHYYYLNQKLDLFLSYASVDELKIFLTVCEQLLDPIN